MYANFVAEVVENTETTHAFIQYLIKAIVPKVYWLLKPDLISPSDWTFE